MSPDRDGRGRRQVQPAIRRWPRTDPALPGALPGTSTGYPEGRLNTKKWFLPAVGAIWDITTTTSCSAMSRRMSASSRPRSRRACRPLRSAASGVRADQGEHLARDLLELYEAGLRSQSRARPRPADRDRGAGQCLSCRFRQPPAPDQRDAGHRLGHRRRLDPAECGTRPHQRRRCGGDPALRPASVGL